MTWPFLKYWGLVISILMWVDMFLGEMFLGRAPNTLFWERIFWQTPGVVLTPFYRHSPSQTVSLSLSIFSEEKNKRKLEISLISLLMKSTRVSVTAN